MSRTIPAPGRITSVLGSQPWWAAGTPDQRRAVAQAVQMRREQAQRRIARLWAHPDLAEHLCHALGYERLDQWNGYVPSTRTYGEYGEINKSPQRRALIEVLKAVAEREKPSESVAATDEAKT
ncbi:hypothetical protein [Actinoplanes sp. NPDC051494]|uniref:hypothetical protein n=1 Tax=Actinoplanes sp. NPDC051494 TaxID=3363907 RepID=UPI0037A97444